MGPTPPWYAWNRALARASPPESSISRASASRAPPIRAAAAMTFRTARITCGSVSSWTVNPHDPCSLITGWPASLLGVTPTMWFTAGDGLLRIVHAFVKLLAIELRAHRRRLDGVQDRQ